ncbi:hypothetical protein E4U57_002731 [Claviceps arundinis]|uniref:lytic cellulose monooxygenase (C4-dehydrogenating) n=1 Tax=Claviceps arundinis TaxID=1623583 RepID=A0A9P7MQG9_9HYPO|nr:hypothetical protein E4U57_002731 [Claviceps arundinis]KAG5964503.1 hypothetical protein E4U56_002159 [Claviceps arundinis]
MAVMKFLLPLCYALTVAAHGRISQVVIKGVAYPGYDSPSFAYNPNPPNVFGWTIKQTDLGFVSPSSYGSADIICHKDAKPAQSHVEVAAGDTVSLQWTPWPASHKGPVLDYLANCNGPCEKVDPMALKFFKIDGAGLLKQSPQTFAADVLIANNNSWQVQIPKLLAPGNYVLRHEIIALHSAGQSDGAQSYPQCFNLKVTGSGTLNPAGVKGTELYKSADSGILSNIYVPKLDYVIPGPAVIPGVPATIDQKILEATATSSATPYGGSDSDPTGSGPAPTDNLSTPAGGSDSTPTTDPNPAPTDNLSTPDGGSDSAPTAGPAPTDNLSTPVGAPNPKPTKHRKRPTKGPVGPSAKAPCSSGKKHHGHNPKGDGKDGQVQRWGQCGGKGWTGPTTCVTGTTCKELNPWYSQCL